MEDDKKELPKQMCTITVIFPTDSDDQAIAVKKKVDEAVVNIADVRVDFRIMNLVRPRV